MTPIISLLTKIPTLFASSTCTLQKPGFFGLPTWYSYLNGQTDAIDPTKCIPNVHSWSQIPAIGLAIIDILLHIGGLIALAFIMYGAFLYVTSNGDPERVTGAKNTILNAIIGLVIVLLAITAVSFIGSSLS